MKKAIISIILCVFMIFCASCSITTSNESLEESVTVSNESVEESLIESEQETTSESVEQEEAPDPTEIDYVYTPLDETVKAEIEAYLGHKFGYDCYYGEFEGKHVFGKATPLAAVDDFQLGAFSLFCVSVFGLHVWDGEEYVDYWGVCDIFSFESSKEIAFIHLNHLINDCWMGCAFKENNATKKTKYTTRWANMVGGTYGDVDPRVQWYLGEYEMKGYFAKQTPTISGDMGFLACNLGVLPGETKERYSLFVTLENVVGYEGEKFSCYGSVADVLDMYQITEDMWLDSYDGFITSDNFDLEKAKSIKYCVPIHLSSPIEGCAEICLVVDNDKDKNTYILIMSVDEETGEKYISQIYQYQWVREQQE